MKYIIVFFLLYLTINGYAQNSISTGGSTATGTGGTATFSMGQIAWNMFTGTNGSIIQGVQQPFEISVINGIDDNEISLKYVIYPNPTRGNVILNTGESNLTGLKYQLFSLSGIILQEKMVETTETEIVLDNYPSGTYLLRITEDQVVLKMYKIVKN